MSRRFVGLAILAALVGCLAMAGGCAAATQSGLYGINDIRTMSAAERAENERLLDVLPDRAKPSVRAELKCSACAGLAMEWENLLEDLYYKQPDPKIYDFEEYFRMWCSVSTVPYGLIVEGGTPTTTYSRRTDLRRIGGLWTRSFMVDFCYELLDEYEDEIAKIDRAGDVFDQLCVDLAGVCQAPSPDDAKGEL